MVAGLLPASQVWKELFGRSFLLNDGKIRTDERNYGVIRMEAGLSTFYEHVVEAAAQSELPVSEVLRKVRGYGFTYLELDAARLRANNYLERHKVAELIKEIRDADLKISCIYQTMDFGYRKKRRESFEGDGPSFDKDHADAARREMHEQENWGNRFGTSHLASLNEKLQGTSALFDLVDLAVSLDVPRIMPIPGFLKKNEKRGSEEYEHVVEDMIEAVAFLCEYAAEKDIDVVMEDFDNEKAPFADSEGLLRFLNAIPELGVAFDTGNFLYSGEDVFRAYDRLKGRIRHVHLKDRSETSMNGDQGLHCPDGRVIYSAPAGFGVLHLDEIVSRLRSDGYNGIYATEHFGSGKQLEDMEFSAKWAAPRIFR